MKPFLLFAYMVSQPLAQGVQWTDGTFALHVLGDEGEETRVRKTLPPGVPKWTDAAVAGLRRFQLHRQEDVSSSSGTGVVVEGVQWQDGSCTTRWLTEVASSGTYTCISDLMFIHGHQGKTKLVWLDEPEAA